MKSAPRKKTASPDTPKTSSSIPAKTHASKSKSITKLSTKGDQVGQPNQYAIFQTGGKQYQAIPGKTVAIEKIDGEAGSEVSFNEVLFQKKGDNTFEFGQPYIKAAKIKVRIVKQTKGPKTIVFKFQRRKKRRTKTGHRQAMTIIRIESI